MPTPRLALFDCDGTLADSQHAIVSAMHAAFASVGAPPPPASAIRATIGLSVPGAIARLAGQLDAATRDDLTEAYRAAYFQARSQAQAAPEPLYDGIPALLQQMAADGWLLGVATGKSRRGLLRLLSAHGLLSAFATLQTADFHPSKPDPAMAFAALDETGVAAARCVVIGDTSYDMAMAQSAGMPALGVTWGYHPAADLVAHGASAIADEPAAIAHLAAQLLEPSA